MSEIGKTKDRGFQVGARKTFPAPIEDIWNFLFSEKGLKIWLGEIKDDLQFNKFFETGTGATGRITTLNRQTNVRLEYKPAQFKNTTMLQVRTISVKDKTCISFAQDKLLNAKQRQEMKLHWNKVLTEIEKRLK